MNAKKWASLKRTALIAIVAVVPAVASGVLSFTESRQSSRTAATKAEKKAEAGYLVTRAAYEQMLKDIAALKTELSLLKELLMNGNLSPGPEVVSRASPLPDPPEVDDIEVTNPNSNTTTTLKKGELPPNLDAAQKVLE